MTEDDYSDIRIADSLIIADPKANDGKSMKEKTPFLEQWLSDLYRMMSVPISESSSLSILFQL